MTPYKKYLAELIGTFSLVFCGTGAIVINDLTNGSITHMGIAVTFGLIVMAMIFTYGSVSGAHINPAVSIGFWALKKLSARDIVPYIVAQLIGALLASVLLLFLFPEHEMLGATLPSGAVLQSFILEIILTFILMLVIIYVSQNPDTAQFTAVAVGATVLLEALFAGPICGASMNPARSIAPAIASGYLEHLWLYILAPVLGALFACLIWRFLR